MSEENRREDGEQKPEEQKPETDKSERGHNWITDIYDKMNVSVKTLDILIVLLCALILFLCIFGNRIHLGIGG